MYRSPPVRELGDCSHDRRYGVDQMFEDVCKTDDVDRIIRDVAEELVRRHHRNVVV